MMKYKPGQIVLCPKTVLGGPLSLIMAIKVSGIDVSTGREYLCFESDQLQSCATIKIGKRTYGTVSGLRFRVCHLIKSDGASREIHVKVRNADEMGEETRAFPIRRRAFIGLTENDKVWLLG